MLLAKLRAFIPLRIRGVLSVTKSPGSKPRLSRFFTVAIAAHWDKLISAFNEYRLYRRHFPVERISLQGGFAVYTSKLRVYLTRLKNA